MEELENILNKITQEVNTTIQQLKQDFETKKVELTQKYQLLTKETKMQLETEFNQNLELVKKRVYTEKFIEYNKKVEQLKNELYKTLINRLKDEINNLNGVQYYNLLKGILLKNIFRNEVNYIVFDNSSKLKKDEQQKLIAEVETEVKKEHPGTKILISEDVEKPDFGIKIITGEKTKRFTIDGLVETVKTYAETELNKLIFENL
ncbi:MAG: hypothetical protein N2555_02620 [Endomicrobia bacterium]|nr:hypothetical protein [Endomicrobiia bacterium]